MVNEERINFHFTLMKDQKLRVHTARLRSTLHGYLRSLITALLSLNYFCLIPVKWAFRIFFRCLALGSSLGTIKAVLQSDAIFYVRLRAYAQYASMNECMCSEHSLRVYRSGGKQHWKSTLTPIKSHGIRSIIRL